MKIGDAKVWATGPPAKAHHVTASGIAVTGSAVMLGVVLTAAAATAKLTIYDGTDSSGGEIVILKAGVEASRPAVLGPTGVRVGTGIYASITGADADAFLYYRD